MARLFNLHHYKDLTLALVYRAVYAVAKISFPQKYFSRPV